VTIFPEDEDALVLARLTGEKISKETKLKDLMIRPQISMDSLLHLAKVKKIVSEADLGLDAINRQALSQIEIQAKYAGYIHKQTLEIQKSQQQEQTIIPENFIFRGIPGLSTEIVEKLTKVSPKTIGVASRIPGMTPAAISLLLIYLKKHSKSVLFDVES
jgi:tRNA uridine 5-carboxymethylaminomethyl modification enzyme